MLHDVCIAWSVCGFILMRTIPSGWICVISGVARAPHSPKASSHPDVTPDTSKQPTVAPTPSFATPVSRRKSLATRKMPSSEVDLNAPDTSFIKVLSDDDSDDSDDDTNPLFWHIFAAWEVIPTGLGDVNALYFTDKSSKYFTHLREILHLIDRQDLLNTPYPLSASLMKKMLKHKLEVEIDGIGNDMTYAMQLSQFIKNQLASCVPSFLAFTGTRALDHMADFHHLDDAKDIWLAVKAKFGGNEEIFWCKMVLWHLVFKVSLLRCNIIMGINSQAFWLEIIEPWLSIARP
ncbi:hypothetical protein Tco_0369795 [Tanacetum coccineum]